MTYTFAGTWNTNIGQMTLTASGSGTFTFCDGKIAGSVSGNKLTGTWTQRFPCGNAIEGSGPVEFTLNPGGQSFSGRWRYASAPDTAWRTDWFATSCASGSCLKNGEELVPKPNAAPIRKGLVAVPITNRQYSLKRVDIASGSTLKICNRDSAFREPLTVQRTGPNAFRVRLKPGACLTHKLVNTGNAPIRVTVVDFHLSQAKLIIFIHPAK